MGCKLTNLIVTMLATFIAVLVMTTQVVWAKPTSNNNNQNVELPVDSKPEDLLDLQHALDTAPRGMDILEQSFIQGKFYKSSDVDKKHNLNASKVIHRNPDNSDDRTGILRVTHGKNQLGSIWGNIDGNNYFDVTKHQTMSMWVYFGHSNDPKDDTKVGDGMALVFQNDNKGVNAISTYNGNPAYGETLGVWGADFNNKVMVSKEEIARTAIQNSFAIEFDTYLNVRNQTWELNGEGVSFDVGKNAKHIAMNYPASPETYVPNKATYGDIRYYMRMQHKQSMESMDMTDSKWHHITMQWNPDQETLSMKYDDKNLDGTKKFTPYIWHEVKMDLNKFNLNGSNKLRWGFTGSTGGQYENNLIVFESIPSYVNADSNVSIMNNSKNKMLSSRDNHVEVGDDLTFIYDLNYKEGSKNWEKILADIELPKNVILNSATITYKGNESNPEAISLGSIENNKLKFELPHDLSKEIPQATIQLHTQVGEVNRSTRVATAHVRFESDNLIVDNDTPEFNIDVPSLIMSTDPAGTVEYSSLMQVPDIMEIHGKVSFANGAQFNPKNITVYHNVNDDYSATALNGQFTRFANFVFYVKKEKLHVGRNVIKMSAKDNRINRTKEYEIIINIGGGLEFGKVHTEVSFMPVIAGTGDQLVQRQEGWKVEVIDSRDVGKTWQLQARAEKMKNDLNNVLDGEIIYRDVNGAAIELKEYTTIFSHIKSTQEMQVTDVVNSWQSDTGILLQLNNFSNAGKYNGKIHWCLVDSI